MKKTKEQKGITLISLVITIILLLILATVAISLAVDSDGLFKKAGDAANKWNTSVAEEQTTLQNLLDMVEKITAKPDTWDGTSDTSWYNDTDTEFVIYTAEQLAGFGELVDNGNTFEGKTIKLGSDIDLKLVNADEEIVSFNPIGTNDTGFNGIFDGQGHTIKNIYQSGLDFGFDWDNYGSIGLFSYLDGATIKNLNLEEVYCIINGGDVAAVAGNATGECTFENITIKKCGIGTYNNGIGSIIGWSGDGNYTFRNINIESDVVLGGLWGNYDASAGGVVGQAQPGASYNFENVNIACQLDVFNDVAASYDFYNYRMCGMIIGRMEETTTIDGKNYPDMTKYNVICNNVTVTYGDWSNYHYCRPTGGKGIRVEAGFEYPIIGGVNYGRYSGIASDYDHSTCTVHHFYCIPFDQIFGGAQLGATGLKEYEGVTVVYNNK